jgi:hypothetical protein
MKRILFISAIAASAILFSFGSAEQTMKKKANGTIVRDCTGTYIRIGEADYLVCNKQDLVSIPDNAMVGVKYKKAKKCPPTDEMVCMMYHEHKGVVYVTKVQWSGGEVSVGKK